MQSLVGSCWGVQGVDLSWPSSSSKYSTSLFTNPDLRASNNGSSTDIICNTDMRVRELQQFCKLQDAGQGLMRAAVAQLNLSTRAYHLTRGVSSLLLFGIHHGIGFDYAPVEMGALFEAAP